MKYTAQSNITANSGLQSHQGLRWHNTPWIQCPMLNANVIIFVSEYLSRIMILGQQSGGYLKAHTELLYIFLFQDYQLPTSVFCDANVFILVKILVIFYLIVQNWTKSIKRSEIGRHVTFPHKTWKPCELRFWFAEAPGMVFLTSNGTKSSQNNHINSFFGAVHPLVEVKWQNTFLSSDKLFQKGRSYQ